MFDHKVVAFGSTNATILSWLASFGSTNATILSWLASIGSTNVATYVQGGINR